MNIIDLREGPRRSVTTRRIAERRLDERRKVVHEFGSSEWLKYINDNQLDCPTIDRRKSERRTEKRQVSERRGEQNPAKPVNSEKKYTRIFLTPAEKKLLEDLYLGDLESPPSDSTATLK
jgi:hypothetical protein